MTRKSSVGTLKSNWAGEEERVTLEEIPLDRATIGRPNWWFTGSLFVPKTSQEHRLAQLQYQTLAQDSVVLSNRAQRIRQYVSILSQWFPVPLLDDVAKELLLETTIRQNDEILLAHFLGILESALRQRHSTIRWKILHEINQTTEHQLLKKDIYKWMFYTRQRKKERISDTLKVIQHLTIELIVQKQLPHDQKRELCLQLLQAIKVLQAKNFVCKDPEITAWALKRILLHEKGVQQDVPPAFRSATTRMAFRLRKIVQGY